MEKQVIPGLMDIAELEYDPNVGQTQPNIQETK